MKYGKSLQGLAVEITRQQETKKDFLIPSQKMQAYSVENELKLAFGYGENESQTYLGGLTQIGHQQLATYTGIPARYYETMRSHSKLLASNVQHWLNHNSDRRMIRVLDGNIRAVLSPKYRRLDHYDLLQSIMPILQEAEATVESCEVTDSRIYIKAITSKVQGEVKLNDVVSAGVLISNSEVGQGSLAVTPLLYRLVCKNGMVANKYASKKYHVGRDNDQIEYKTDTVMAEDKAFWLKTRDLVTESLSQVKFDLMMNDMKISTTLKLEDPQKSVEMVSDKFKLRDTETNDLVRFLMLGGDMTSWGLANATTSMAQLVKDYDRSTELESVGFEIMTNNWN